MSKFNKTAVDKAVTRNYEGEKSWKLDDELALYTRVCTTFLVDQFYTPNFNDELNRIRTLIKKVNPQFVAQLAVYAREEMYLRSIPLVLAVELAKVHSGDNLVRRMVSRIIQRADELTEIVAYYTSANARHKNVKEMNGQTKVLYALSKQMARGIADAFYKFDEYQLKKYSAADKEIKLRDVLFLTHPKPRNKEEKDLFARVANNELSKANTWETESSDMGQKVAQQAKEQDLDEKERNDLKIQAAKEMWEAKVDARGKGQLNYMALMRNLMNFLKYDISLDHIKKVAARLADEKEVARSKQMPFRFVTAYRMLRGIENINFNSGNFLRYHGSAQRERFVNNESIYEVQKFDIPHNKNKNVKNPKISILLEALEEAVKTACKNIPSFDWDTNVLIAADTSGSMQQQISPKSMLQCYDIGLALSMMLQYKCKVVSAGMFGDSFAVLPFPKDQILRNVDEMHQFEGMVGYSTNGYLVIDYAIRAAKEGIVFDKIFLFSDNQLWNSRRDLEHIDGEWKKFKKVAPKAKLYIFDLAGYGTSPIDLKQNDVYMVAGWSDKIFDVLKAIDEGQDALKKIKAIEV
jgi:hypothetical protein